LPLTIPVPSVKELSPEELDPLKDALLAHLRSQNAVTRDQVDKNLHVTRGEKVPAYSFTLHFLLETRDAVPRPFVKPFTEEEAQRFPSSGNLSPISPAGIPDLWSFPSEERLDFNPHADSYFLPGTLHVEDCRDCFQRGETGCKACLGKGVEACPTCLGAGRQPCVYCKGTEKVPCLRCGGEGRLSSGEVGGRSAGCDACAGKGKFSCTHCTGGKLSCPVCGGGGKAPCAKCKGQGKMVCGMCGGQKKIISGQAFQASFKPAQARSASLVESGPREVLELALLKTSDAGSIVLGSQESFEKQVQELEVPAPFRKALDELGEREKAHLSPTTRVVKRRLDLAEGFVVRICGYCAGQEFSYWMLPGTNHLIAEKDPLTSFGVSAASSAEEARVAGDWKKAISQAREALAYSPDHVVARDILKTWERKVLQDVLWAGGGGVLFAAMIRSLWIWQFEKGLHKAGTFFWTSGLQFVLGFLGAGILAVILIKTRHYFSRGIVLALGFAGVFLLSTTVGQWATRWKSVRAADQAVLDQEIQGHFIYGFPEVFYEPDFVFLQNLYDKYNETQVDLGRLSEALAVQRELKDDLAVHQEEFNRKVRSLLAAGAVAGQKRAQLTQLRDRYRLMGVDVSLADAALQQKTGGTTKSGTAKSASSSRIKIHSASPSKKKQTLLTPAKKPKASPKSKVSPKAKVRSADSLKNFPPTEPKPSQEELTSAPPKKSWWE
jgi:hypothetical protein